MKNIIIEIYGYLILFTKPFPNVVVQHSTFMEIHFAKLTQLAKLTNVHSSASLYILHPDVLCKKYTRVNFTNKIHSKSFLQNALEHTLLHKLLSAAYCTLI